MKHNGRPEHTDEQYKRWLDEMKPFLKAGYSLYFAIDKADLIKHKNSIYRKSSLKDWFWEKIEYFQSYPGEIANSAIVHYVSRVNDKILQRRKINRSELRMLKFFCTHHRSCRPYFVLAGEGRQTKAYDKIDEKQNTLTKEEFEEMDIIFKRRI